MYCKVFFFQNENEWKGIKSSLRSIKDPFHIITTNSKLDIHLKQIGLNSKLFEEEFPRDADETYEINRLSRKKLQKYHDIFLNLFFQNIEIFSSIENQILNEIILLEKTQRILSGQKNIIFILENFFPSYFLILKLAEKMNYNIDDFIYQFKKNKTKKIYQKNCSHLLPSKRKILINKIFQSPLKNNLIHSGKESPKKEKFDKKSSLNIIDLFRISIRLGFLIFYGIINSNNVSPILKKIGKKIENSSVGYDAKCIFYITAPRYDVIKPILSICQKFEEDEVPFQICAFDFLTRGVLIKKQIIFLDLFEETLLLSKLLKKNSAGKQFLLKINDKINDSELPLLQINSFVEYLIDEIFQACAVIYICNFIYEKMNPQSAVFAVGYRKNVNAAIAVTKKRSIKTFSILTQRLYQDPILTDLYKAEKLCIYGKQGFDKLIELGYNKDRIIITGNPRYDYLDKISHEESLKLIKKKIKISQSKIIIIAMSRWHDNDEIWMSNIINYANRKNYNIIIKIHPIYKLLEHDFSEHKISIIKKNCSDLQFHITYDFDFSILLGAADIIITDYSNIGIETILAKRPLVTVNFTSKKFENVENFHDYRASIYIDEYEKLETVIEEILQDKHADYFDAGREKIAELYNAFNDGKTSKRIFKELIDN